MVRGVSISIRRVADRPTLSVDFMGKSSFIVIQEMMLYEFYSVVFQVSPLVRGVRQT